MIHKEVCGFVADRLQRALFTECLRLVRMGVVTVDELEDERNRRQLAILQALAAAREG